MNRGCVVISSAGKDKGCVMAVLQAGPGCLWVADGRKRPVQHPKRKNPRHVLALDRRLTEDSMATNRELRRALAAVRPEAEDAGQQGGCLPGDRRALHKREVI